MRRSFRRRRPLSLRALLLALFSLISIRFNTCRFGTIKYIKPRVIPFFQRVDINRYLRRIDRRLFLLSFRSHRRFSSIRIEHHKPAMVPSLHRFLFGWLIQRKNRFQVVVQFGVATVGCFFAARRRLNRNLQLSSRFFCRSFRFRIFIWFSIAYRENINELFETITTFF